MDGLFSVDQLEARANAAGLSMNEVCRRAGIARSTFTRWKAGETLPTLRVLRKVNHAIDNDEPTEPTAPARAETTGAEKTA